MRILRWASLTIPSSHIFCCKGFAWW